VRGTGPSIADLGFWILDCFDMGFGIADFGFNGKAHGAEGIALEVSEISELSTCTPCAMLFAL
jgi:hypothetical protein